jgi:hypothetical protein
MRTPVIITVVGLPGAGKTEATTRFVKHQFVRVGFTESSMKKATMSSSHL